MQDLIRAGANFARQSVGNVVPSGNFFASATPPSQPQYPQTWGDGVVRGTSPVVVGLVQEATGLPVSFAPNMHIEGLHRWVGGNPGGGGASNESSASTSAVVVGRSGGGAFSPIHYTAKVVTIWDWGRRGQVVILTPTDLQQTLPNGSAPRRHLSVIPGFDAATDVVTEGLMSFSGLGKNPRNNAISCPNPQV